MSRTAFAIASLVLVLAAGISGCAKKDNLLSCQGAGSSSAACLDASTIIDTPLPPTNCKSNTECNASFPVCDTAETPSACVRCTTNEHAACTGTTPVCATDHSCTGCTMDDDCGTGGRCLPTGACATPDNIIHAIATGGNPIAATCGGVGAGNPCTLTAAIAAVNATRNVISLDEAGTYTPDAPTTTNFVFTRSATIFASGATLDPRVQGAIVSIMGNASVTVIGGTMEQAANGIGIVCNGGTLTIMGTTISNCDQSAIDATNCTITVDKATLVNNSQTNANVAVYPGISVAGGSITLSRTVISGTKGGGLFITGGSSNNAKFNIVGNAFMANGESAHSTIGGVKIDTSAFADNRFEFNTVLQNKTNTSIQSGIPTIAGIQCDVPDFVAKNNIVWDNNSQLNNNMPPGPDQVSGTCKYSYSDLGPAGVPTLNDSDGTNFNVNPPFLNESTDYHLQPANQVQQSADPMADLTGIAATDIDGDARVKPATLGADQVSP